MFDQTLRFCDGLFVERGNPDRKRVDKSIELGVRQSTIDVTIDVAHVCLRIWIPAQHNSEADWLKDAIKMTAYERDPIEAMRDARRLLAMLGERYTRTVNRNFAYRT
jgi:hypothetical protein